jgi:rod shape-determining protein MreD
MSRFIDSRINFQFVKVRMIIYALAAFILSLMHIMLLNFISVGGMTPDFLVILCVFISIYEGQFVGVIAAFLIGLFFDIVSFDLIGTNALSKTIVGFFAGYFFKKGFEKITLGSIKFLIVVFISNLLNNLVYYMIFTKPSELSFLQFFLRYGLSMSFYTTVFAGFITLFNFRRKE